jgi:hypothetical protein
MAGESIDQAFEIGTTPEEPQIQRLVADDWPCNGQTPIVAAVWWGSYMGYGYEACQYPPGSFMPLPVKPDYFLLTIWDDIAADDPNNQYTYSHPNDIIWQYRAHKYDEVLVGYDKYDIYGQEVSPNEPVFRYSVRLPESEWFHQEDVNGVYWFSVVAVYDVNRPNYSWGWTNHEHVYNDDAVGGWYDMYSGEWLWDELWSWQANESIDMSFILFTEPGCFPSCHDDYWIWMSVGKPYCWCNPRQCYGDAAWDTGGSTKTGQYWVGASDLAILLNAWEVCEPPFGPGVSTIPQGICADFAHDVGGSTKTGQYRVGASDLAILLTNWDVCEPPFGPGIPSDCLKCP